MPRNISPYRIRLAEEKDIPHLYDLEQQANTLFLPYGITFDGVFISDDEYRDHIHFRRLWVAVTADDQPVGIAIASTLDDNAHLDELGVHPAHGRRGLGSALVETVCGWAKESGFTSITLTTLRHIPWNTPYYEKLGFRVLEENERSDAQRQLLLDEIANGLPGEGRVIMIRGL